jgi:hypothetical protein
MQWLIFAIIGAAVAYGIHRLSREKYGEKDKAFTPAPDKSILPAQDMVQCSVCQAYVVKGATHCGRENCPYSGRTGEDNNDLP